MRNTIVDVHNTMLECLERLNDPDLSGKKLDAEIKRAQAMATVSQQVITNMALMLKVRMAVDESCNQLLLPQVLDGDAHGSH